MKGSGAKPKKVPSGGTNVAEVRDTTGTLRGQFRPGAFFTPENAAPASAARKKPKATNVDPRVTEYATVLAHAVDTFGSRINANEWLNRPNRIFNNKSPLQILTQDPASVEEELVRIDHGIFV